MPNPEQQPLLGTSRDADADAAASTTASRLKTHLTTSVSRKHTDLVLLACYIITGLLDSASNQIWGSFVSMQTGNTIYIGLGLAAPRDEIGIAGALWAAAVLKLVLVGAWLVWPAE
ncbi:hypothetical protein VdG1_04018 [Verticillium dahliae VDG1]|nr:hypothetical protein VdG1_04018 [Verticillium dahliae VDG1]